MSGTKCFEVLDKIFKPKKQEKIENIKGYTLKYGHIVENTEIVDEVLVSYFKAPKSYTAENMCEINTHGGNVIVRKILDLCLKNGAELAEPGEFTKRAFLNGRIDLSQAESVIDVIDAKSEKEAKAGIKQLEGALSKKINEIKQEIMDVMINIDVSIDYPEYDVDDVTNSQILDMLDSVCIKLEKLEKSFDNGKIVKEGIKTAIIGKPNAGKSSLLNAILKEDRAIVTEYAGTTRDTIEEFATVEGIPLKLIDTAGIRNANDEVEKIGVDIAKKKLKNAMLVIEVFDISRELDEEDLELLEYVKKLGKKVIIVLNKSDLENVVERSQLEKYSDYVIEISAKLDEGREELQKATEKLLGIGGYDADSTIFANERQIACAERARKYLAMALESLDMGETLDAVTVMIDNGANALLELTGEKATEAVVDEVFSKFCVGK